MQAAVSDDVYNIYVLCNEHASAGCVHKLSREPPPLWRFIARHYCGITVLDAGQMSLVKTLSDIPAATTTQNF